MSQRSSPHEQKTIKRSTVTKSQPKNSTRVTRGRDGKDGKPGKDGKNGVDGKPGRDGSDGYNGKDGASGCHGKDGTNGIDGCNGRNGINGSSSALGSTLLSSTIFQPRISDNLKFQEVSLEQKQMGICTNWHSKHNAGLRWSSTDTGQYSITYRVGINSNFDPTTITTVRMASMLTLNDTPIPASQAAELTSSAKDYRQLTATVLINYFAGQELALQWWGSGYVNNNLVANNINVVSLSVGFNEQSQFFCPATTDCSSTPFNQTTASLTILRVLLP